MESEGVFRHTRKRPSLSQHHTSSDSFNMGNVTQKNSSVKRRKMEIKFSPGRRVHRVENSMYSGSKKRNALSELALSPPIRGSSSSGDCSGWGSKLQSTKRRKREVATDIGLHVRFREDNGVSSVNSLLGELHRRRQHRIQNSIVDKENPSELKKRSHGEYDHYNMMLNRLHNEKLSRKSSIIPSFTLRVPLQEPTFPVQSRQTCIYHPMRRDRDSQTSPRLHCAAAGTTDRCWRNLEHVH